jgi:tetratricopeptide (TPR) repeat protein
MRAFLLSALVVAISVGVGFWVSRTWAPHPPAPAMGKPQPTRITLPKKLKRLYEQPRMNLGVAQLISPACQSLWSEIEALDTSNTEIAPKFPSARDCKGLSAALEKFQSTYDFLCASPANKEAVSDCLGAFYQYRAHITEYLTKNTALQSIDDTKILVDKMIATFITDPHQAMLVADRVLEIDPAFYEAAKAGLLASIMAAQKNNAHQLWEDASRRLRENKISEPSDSYAQDESEILMLTLKNRNADEVFELAAELDSRYPTKTLGPYFLAWAENERGNRDTAIAYLKEAIARDPSDIRLQQTLQAFLSTPGKVTGAFTLTQSYSFFLP